MIRVDHEGDWEEVDNNTRPPDQQKTDDDILTTADMTERVNGLSNEKVATRCYDSKSEQ